MSPGTCHHRDLSLRRWTPLPSFLTFPETEHRSHCRVDAILSRHSKNWGPGPRICRGHLDGSWTSLSSRIYLLMFGKTEVTDDWHLRIPELSYIHHRSVTNDTWNSSWVTTLSKSRLGDGRVTTTGVPTNVVRRGSMSILHISNIGWVFYTEIILLVSGVKSQTIRIIQWDR